MLGESYSIGPLTLKDTKKMGFVSESHPSPLDTALIEYQVIYLVFLYERKRISLFLKKGVWCWPYFLPWAVTEMWTMRKFLHPMVSAYNHQNMIIINHASKRLKTPTMAPEQGPIRFFNFSFIGMYTL